MDTVQTMCTLLTFSLKTRRPVQLEVMALVCCPQTVMANPIPLPLSTRLTAITAWQPTKEEGDQKASDLLIFDLATTLNKRWGKQKGAVVSIFQKNEIAVSKNYRETIAFGPVRTVSNVWNRLVS